MTKYWTLEHLIRYLNTWSGLKNFIKQNDFNPVYQLQTEIAKLWDNNEIKEVRFPILLRVELINKNKLFSC